MAFLRLQFLLIGIIESYLFQKQVCARGGVGVQRRHVGEEFASIWFEKGYLGDS